MQAVIYTQYGPPDVLHLAEVEKPTPKDNEVLIKVHASTVTTGDCNMRNFVFVPRGFGLLSRLMFGIRGPRKQILGVEVAGVIEAIGKDVTSFKVGDEVFGIDGMRVGAYAEYKCMPENAGLVTKSANLSYEEAVAIPNGALTAYTFLKDVKQGQQILVNGASGSVGSAAVQIAKHLGATVTGVCSTPNIDLVKSLGADHVIDYTKEDFTQNGETYDIIFDTVGKTSFSGCKQSLKPNGQYHAVAGGIREMLQMLWTSLIGSKKVKAGPSSESQENLTFIRGLVEQGKIRPIIDKTYPLKEIVEAHQYVDTGRKKGNVVIKVMEGTQ